MTRHEAHNPQATVHFAPDINQVRFGTRLSQLLETVCTGMEKSVPSIVRVPKGYRVRCCFRDWGQQDIFLPSEGKCSLDNKDHVEALVLAALARDITGMTLKDEQGDICTARHFAWLFESREEILKRYGFAWELLDDTNSPLGQWFCQTSQRLDSSEFFRR